MWLRLDLANVCRVINLTKNSQLYVRHGDVERLIAQGFLERLS
jgi:GINS complex subunit 1